MGQLPALHAHDRGGRQPGGPLNAFQQSRMRHPHLHVLENRFSSELTGGIQYMYCCPMDRFSKLGKQNCLWIGDRLVFSCNWTGFCHSRYSVPWRGLCVWVTLPRSTLLNVEPGRKAGRRFDSSPFRQQQGSSNSSARIEKARPQFLGRPCL
jgi:hypothetical protein